MHKKKPHNQTTNAILPKQEKRVEEIKQQVAIQKSLIQQKNLEEMFIVLKNKMKDFFFSKGTCKRKSKRKEGYV